MAANFDEFAQRLQGPSCPPPRTREEMLRDGVTSFLLDAFERDGHSPVEIEDILVTAKETNTPPLVVSRNYLKARVEYKRERRRMDRMGEAAWLAAQFPA